VYEKYVHFSKVFSNSNSLCSSEVAEPTYDSFASEIYLLKSFTATNPYAIEKENKIITKYFDNGYESLFEKFAKATVKAATNIIVLCERRRKFNCVLA